jgi:aldose 1-epimerase
MSSKNVVDFGSGAVNVLLTNGRGVEATVSSFGAMLLSVKTPNRAGASEEITLNHWDAADVDAYKASTPQNFYGVTVGRFGNRIKDGKFAIDGVQYSVPVNNGPNSLHGGISGFDKKVWTVDESYVADSPDVVGVRFKLISPDGDEGYPGTLTAHVTYELSSGDESAAAAAAAGTVAGALSMTWEAWVTGKATAINLTNHAYWNLSGRCVRPVAGQELRLMCTRVLPVSASQIPTGEVVNVADTEFDFLAAHPIGDHLLRTDGAGQPGYDHCFVVDHADGAPSFLAPTVEMSDPVSGRTMAVATTQPGVQVYTGNWIDGSGVHRQHNAICFETQGFPDGCNQRHFPGGVLRPGEHYCEKTVHSFGFAPSAL